MNNKIFFENYIFPLMYHVLSAKYKDPTNEENFKMGMIYKKKLANNLFKVCYYSLIENYELIIQCLPINLLDP